MAGRRYSLGETKHLTGGANFVPINEGHPERIRAPVRAGLSLVFAGGLRRSRFVLARGHGNDDVLALLVVEFWYAEDELVFADAELCDFTNGQKHGVLFVGGANAIDDVV